MNVRIASWNIRGNNGVGAARRRRIVETLANDGADIVLLQEVAWKGDLHLRLRDDLAGVGLEGFAYSGVVDSTDKRYGNVIASRWPLREVPLACTPPWPQSLLAAEVDCPAGSVEAISAHIPNGSGNGWAKVETLEALAEHLETMSRLPRVVGGDFNEPRAVQPDGRLVPFGGRRLSDGTWSHEGSLRGTCGRTFPRRRWSDAVGRVLGVDAAHGLVHAGRAAIEPALFLPTHLVRGKPRFFDHLLVSRNLQVEAAGYEHAPRESGVSDHSVAWCCVRFG